ncbi:MAG: DUF6586 family protein [Pseudomonadota bacterium]
MSGARARANHSLYLARILIRSWQTAQAEQQASRLALAQAFTCATRDHLLEAYGWFLLQIAAPDSLPEAPPRSCAELPQLSPGKARSGEISEFVLLENDGWLAQLLNTVRPSAGGLSSRDPRNLAAPVAAVESSAEQFAEWADALAEIFDRMGDSLDEY